MPVYALSIASSLPSFPKAIQDKFKLGWKQCVHLTLRIAALADRLFAFLLRLYLYNLKWETSLQSREGTRLGVKQSRVWASFASID